jgi:hypothetical protein
LEEGDDGAACVADGAADGTAVRLGVDDEAEAAAGGELAEGDA